MGLRISPLAGDFRAKFTYVLVPTGDHPLLVRADPTRYALGFASSRFPGITISPNDNTDWTEAFLLPSEGIEWFKYADAVTFTQVDWYASINIRDVDVCIFEVFTNER